MAKRPLGAPKAPPGPQLEFFDLLQQTVRQHGDLPLSEIVNGGLYCSRQVLHRALVGPALPSRKLVEQLTHVLGCSTSETEAVTRAYRAAQEDQIQRQRQTGAPTRRAQPSSAARDALAEELRAVRDASGLSISRLSSHGREVYVPRSTLYDWLSGRSLPRSESELLTLIELLERATGRPLKTRAWWVTTWRKAREEHRLRNS
jgi:DNA-binding transcriptional regulator YiaG